MSEFSEQEVWEALLKIFPDAEFSADDDAFLVIHTGVMYTGNSGENLIGNMNLEAINAWSKSPRSQS